MDWKTQHIIKISILLKLTHESKVIAIKTPVKRGGVKGTLLHCGWEYKLVQPLWRWLKKLKIEISYDPAIPLLGIYPEKNMIHALQGSLQHCLQQPRHGSNLNVHQQMSG